MARILIVDDERSVTEVLRIVLRGSGYEVQTAGTAAEARSAFIEHEPDLVLQDLRMRQADDGIKLLSYYKQERKEVPVLVITAHSSWDNTLSAMRHGAYDFIKKPFDNEAIREVVARALAHRQTQRREGNDELNPTEMMGNTPGMRALLNIIERVASTDSTVLVTGESGTGKELAARALHYCSTRRGKPFISVNAGAIPANLLESELFGHVRGAFSGAHADKKGLIEVADGGSFFFDEVGELPLEMQVKLLRVLEDQHFFPVGGTSPRSVDVRFIGATNKDLSEEVQSGRFREDLFYRLNVIPIHLPPLRDRKDDIVLLASHFVAKFSKKMHREIGGISPQARRRLEEHDWPGNVRELQNTIERSVALARGKLLEEVLVQRRGGPGPSTLAAAAPVTVAAGETPLPGDSITLEVPAQGLDLERRLADVERAFIQAALDQTGGHLTNAAKLLGISFRSIRYKVQKLDIKTKEQ